MSATPKTLQGALDKEAADCAWARIERAALGAIDAIAKEAHPRCLAGGHESVLFIQVVSAVVGRLHISTKARSPYNPIGQAAKLAGVTTPERLVDLEREELLQVLVATLRKGAAAPSDGEAASHE